jgi:predicted amidophosphoribosyltransferase
MVFRYTGPAMLGRMLSKLLALVVPALCVACGADAGRAAPLCRECRVRMQPASPAGIWAAFSYEGPAGAMVRALKFGGRTRIADAMAAQIAALAPPELLCGTVVPVPVHPAHRRRRGLDHGAALARALARRAGLAFTDCLVRSGDPLPQVGRGRRARIRGPAGSIAVRPGMTPPLEVLLVDDVITTGATLAACDTALRVAGCTRITPIAYARTTAR